MKVENMYNSHWSINEIISYLIRNCLEYVSKGKIKISKYEKSSAEFII